MELDQKVKDAVKTISDWVEENKDERCFILIMDTVESRIESCNGYGRNLSNAIINTLMSCDEEDAVLGKIFSKAFDKLLDVGKQCVEEEMKEKLMKSRTKNEA